MEENTEEIFELKLQEKPELPSVYVPEYNITVKTEETDPFVVRYLAGRRGMNIPRTNFFGMENMNISREKIANGIINQAVRAPANIVASGAMSTYRQAVGIAKSAMDMGRRYWELFGLEQEQNDELTRLQQLKTEGKISESDYIREKGRIEDEYIKKSTAIHQKFLEADRISNEQMARLKKAGEEWLAEAGIARTDRDGFVYDFFGGATSLAVGIGLYLLTKSPAAAGAVFGVVTGRDNYEEALENGKSRETAAQVGLWSGFAQTALEGFGAEQIVALPRAVKAAKAAKVATQAAKTTTKTPTQAFFQEFGEQATAKWLKSSGIGARATYSAFTEAAEEGVQNVADDGIMTMWGGREKDIKSILTDAIYSAVIGGITGGFAGGVRGAFDKVYEKAQKRKEEQAKKTTDKSQPKSDAKPENEKKGELPKTSEIKPIELENPKVVKETTQQPQQIDTEAARSVIEGHSFDTFGNLRDAEGKIVKTAGDMEDTHKSRIYMYQLLREATVRKLMSEIGMNRKAAGIFADKALAQAADIVQNTIPQLIDNELNEATFDGRKAEIAAELKEALQKIGKKRLLNKQFNSELDEVYREYYDYGKQNGLNDTQAEYMGRWQRTRMQVYSMYTGMSPKYLSEQMRIGLSNKSSKNKSNSSKGLTQPESSQSGIDDNSARGSVTFENNSLNALVELFKGADASTLPHELAHVFLMDMQRLAALNPNGRLAGMFEDLREAIGEPEGEIPGTYSREQQEHFAKMWERYLAEEHAPTKAWQRVFSVFKEWLRGVYKTFKDFPELSPAAKSLFDKWLSFDDTNNIPNTEELKEYKEKTNALKAVAEAAKENRDTETDGITVQDVKAVLNVTRMARPEEPEAVKAYNEALAIADEITESQAEANGLLEKIEDMEHRGARQFDSRDVAMFDKAIADIQAIEDNPDIEIPGITDTEELPQPLAEIEATAQPGSETADRPETQTVQEETEEKRKLPGTYIHKEEDGTYSLKGRYYAGSYYKSGRIKENRGWEDVEETGTIFEGFKTEEEARAFASRLAEMQEDLPGSGGAKAERAGLPRRPKNSQAGKGLLKMLGFKDVKTGRELTKGEEKALASAAYDGIYDLAEILNIPPESLALNGTLTIKLGAPKTDIKPGEGAKYRAKDKTIIMEAEAGSGRFAAAWYAAFTDYMQSPDIRPEMKAAFNELRKAINSRKLTAEEIQREQEKSLKEAEKGLKEANDAIDNSEVSFELYELVDEINSSNRYIEAYPIEEENLFDGKPQERQAGVDNRIIDEAYQAAGEQGARLISDLIAAHNNIIAVESMDFSTDLSRFAADYSAATGKTTADSKEKSASETELEAAAFASYIYNRLLEKGGKNTFLARPDKGRMFDVRRALREDSEIIPDAEPGEAGDPFAYPYPVGRERQAIFNAFDKVFSTLKYETTESGKVRLYQEGDSGITFFQDKKDIVVKNYTDRENPSRITQREKGTFLPEEQAAFDSFFKRNGRSRSVLGIIEAHHKDDEGKTTGYYKSAIEAIFTQEALERYFAGEEIDFESSIDASPNLKEILESKEFKEAKTDDDKIKLIYINWLRNSLLGNPRKTGNAVNSSMLNCHPSKSCAKYCYASNFPYLTTANLAKPEVVDFIARKAPAKLAEWVVKEYSKTDEYEGKTALRFFDKGDGDKHWVDVVKEVNDRGVRVAIFTKKPDFMRAIKELKKGGQEYNLTMLSIDSTNRQLAEQNKDLIVAYVYQAEDEIIYVVKLKNEKRLAVILPVKRGQTYMSETEIDKLINAGLNDYICPIDSGKKVMPDSNRKGVRIKSGKLVSVGTKLVSEGKGKNKKKIEKEIWTCALCDLNGGAGCFYKKTTEIIERLIKKAKGNNGIIKIEELIALADKNPGIKKLLKAGLKAYGFTETSRGDNSVLQGELEVSDDGLRDSISRFLVWDSGGSPVLEGSEENTGTGRQVLGTQDRSDVRNNETIRVVSEQTERERETQTSEQSGPAEILPGRVQGNLGSGESITDEDNADNNNNGQTLYQSAKNNLPETIDIDGEQKPTTNSEGRPIAATEEGIRNFYKWFGDSKAVDQDGRPLVVYHGTEEDFDAFDMSKGRANMDIQGSFFSPWELDAKGYGRNVMPVYLSIRTPADEGTGYKALRKFQGQNYAGKKAKEYLESQGYDGVINNGEEYIVFNPNQIKSTDNTGTFDPGNPNIFYQSSKEPDRFRREDYAYGFRPEKDTKAAIRKINAVIEDLIKEVEKRKGDEAAKAAVIKTLRSAIGYKGYLARVRQARSIIDEAQRRMSDQKLPFKEQPTLTPEKEAELDAAFDEPAIEKIKRKAGKLAAGSAEAARDLGRSVSDRAAGISPKLKLAFREFTRKFNLERTAHSKALEPFIKAYRAMSEKDRRRFTWAAFNGDTDTIEKYKQEYKDLAPALETYRQVLDDIYNKAAEAGFDVGYIQDYFPRKVKDYKGLMTYLKKTKEWTFIEEYLKKELNIKDPDKWMTDGQHDDVIADIINRYMRGTGFEGRGNGKPGNIKKRRIIEVTGEMMAKYYYALDESILMYAASMDKAIQARKLFGYDLLHEEDTVGMIVKDIVEERKAAHAKNPEIPELTTDDEAELMKDINAFLHPQGPGELAQTIKDWGYMLTLVSPISTITQLEDLSVAIVENGAGRTVSAAFETARKKGKKIALEDIGVEQYDIDINSGRMSQKILGTALKATGFSAFDRFGKETFILSDFNKRVEQVRGSKKGRADFIAECEMYGYEPERIKNMVECFMKGDINDLNDDAKSLLFYDLAEVQPIDLAEMPVDYLRGGNLRIAYALKTFTLKRLNYLITKTQRLAKKGQILWDNGDKAGAMAEWAKGVGIMTWTLFLLVAAGASMDWLKDLILRRQSDVPSLLVDNLLKQASFNRWEIKRAAQEGIFPMLIAKVLPPVAVTGQDAVIDYFRVRDGKLTLKDIKFWNHFPVIGRFYYWWFGGGKLITEKQKEKEARKKRAKKRRQKQRRRE